jgi:hypothetical protein
VLHDTPPRLRAARRDAPAALERALALALQKDPRKRPQTVAEWAEQLAPFGSPAARESLARIQAIKRAPPVLPAAARGRTASESIAQTLTLWASHVVSLRSAKLGRPAVLLGVALAVAALLALSWEIYRVLGRAAPAEVAGPPVSGAVVHESLKANLPPPAPAVSSTVTAPTLPSPSAHEPPLPVAKRRVLPRVAPAAAAKSAEPAKPDTEPQPPADPYLHRK